MFVIALYFESEGRTGQLYMPVDGDDLLYHQSDLQDLHLLNALKKHIVT